MPVTAHMKVLLHEAEIEHQYRRRQSHIDDPRYKARARDYYAKDPKIKKRTVIYDDTQEQLDSYSNIDVGTRFRHLPFIYNKHGKRIGGRNEPLNFAHIVDLDTSYYNRIVYTTFLREVLASLTFRTIIMILVLVNAVVIGLNTVDVNDHYKKELEIVDQVLFTAFAFEIFIKMAYDFRAFWIVLWNILDFIIFLWILYAMCLPVFLSPRTLLITVRVAQALRSLRFLSTLSSLTVVSHTMFKSVVDMVNILFVLIIFMVVMAIAGVVLFDDEKLKTSRFLSALDAWFVLFICVTQDGWIEVLNQFRDTGFFLMISLYLIIGVTIGAFVFANLIIAVVVANLESSIKAIKADKIHTANPLEYDNEFSPNEVDIISVYKPFRRHYHNLLEQRPSPRLKTAKRRRLRCYVHLLVALEQNMLEFSAIEEDMIRLLSIFLSIFDQLETDDKVSEKNRKRFLQMAKDKYDQPVPEGSAKIERPRKFMDPSKTPYLKAPAKTEESTSYGSSSDYSIDGK